MGVGRQEREGKGGKHQDDKKRWHLENGPPREESTKGRDSRTRDAEKCVNLQRGPGAERKDGRTG